jgi:hypothetical protein
MSELKDLLSSPQTDAVVPRQEGSYRKLASIKRYLTDEQFANFVRAEDEMWRRIDAVENSDDYQYFAGPTKTSMQISRKQDQKSPLWYKNVLVTQHGSEKAPYSKQAKQAETTYYPAAEHTERCFRFYPRFMKATNTEPIEGVDFTRLSKAQVNKYFSVDKSGKSPRFVFLFHKGEKWLKRQLNSKPPANGRGEGKGKGENKTHKSKRGSKKPKGGAAPAASSSTKGGGRKYDNPYSNPKFVNVMARVNKMRQESKSAEAKQAWVDAGKILQTLTSTRVQMEASRSIASYFPKKALDALMNIKDAEFRRLLRA